MQKLYCYVDESGQDTAGKIFIVSVVVAGEERDKLLELCEQLERVSGKRKDKWGKARHKHRMRYIRHIFADDRFKRSLRYCVFRQVRDFDTATVKAICSVIRWEEPAKDYTTLI